MSDLLLDGIAKTIDMAAFRLSRFAERKPVKASSDTKTTNCPLFQYAGIDHADDVLASPI
jgi:hypothetical protein